MIELRNIDKYFNKNKQNEIHVLNNINLKLPDKGLVSFCGASGSGKTTLLNVLGGLDKASGEIYYNGKLLTKSELANFHSENVSLIFQNYLLLDDLSVYDNLVTALNIIGLFTKDEITKRIKLALEAVDMYKYRNKKVGNLSGGQQQRIAIARALLKDAKVLLCDEPTGNLDKKNAVSIMNLLKSLSKNRLILLVTHNNDLAYNYSDLIIHIKDGKITKGDFNDNDILNKDIILDDAIYLEDYQKEEYRNNDLEIMFYTNSNNKTKLRIIENKGKIYIVADSDIKIIKPNSIKEARVKEVYQEIDFKTDWYSKDYKNGRIGTFKDNLKAYFNVKKTKKIFRIAYTFLGFIFTMMMFSFLLVANISRPSFAYLEDKYMIESDSFFDTSDYVEKLLERDYIENLNAGMTGHSFKEVVNSLDERYYDSNYIYDFKSNFKGNIIYGTDSGALMSKSIADDLIYNEYFKDYKEIVDSNLLAMTQEQRQFETPITGITNLEDTSLYIPDKEILYAQYHYTAEYSYNFYEIEELKENYKIIKGRDIENSYECLVSSDLEGLYEIGEFTYGNESPKRVVGIIESDYLYDKAIVSRSHNQRYDIYSIVYNTYDEYKIIAGRDLENSNECLLYKAHLNDYEIGSTFKDKKIVGFYDTRSGILKNGHIVTKDRYLIDFVNGNTFNFDIKEDNLETVKEYLSKYGLEVKNVYDYRKEVYTDYNKTDMLIFGITALVLGIIYLFFTYFMMRSKLLSEKRQNAIYRNIGAKKQVIYNKYFKDIIILNLFTSLIGYTLAFIMVRFTNVVSFELLRVKFFDISIWLYLGGFALMFIINAIIGMLPIILEMRKRPAELISSYDL